MSDLDLKVRTTPTFLKQRQARFQLQSDSGVPRSWVRDVIRRLDELPQDGHFSQRRRGVVDLPNGLGSEQAFIKVFHHASPRHHKWRRKCPVQRLRRRYADHEGRALRHLASAGIPVPRVLFYGEEWRFGVRSRGVVATEAIEAPTLFEVFARGVDRHWLDAYSRTLARIHAARLSHGDAHSQNFLVHDSHLVTIDLENSRALTPKKKTSDLVTMVSSVLHATGCEGLANSALESYRSAGGLSDHLIAEDLLELGHLTEMGVA